VNERDKALLEAIEAVQVEQLTVKTMDISECHSKIFMGISIGLKKAAQIIAKLRKEDHANTEEG